MANLTKFVLLSSLLCAAPSGCADEGESAPPSSSSDDIVGATTSAGFPEVVLVDMDLAAGGQAICSGTVVAPRVVLTAGHCVEGVARWRVTAPNAGGQTASSSRGITDYVSIVVGKPNFDAIDVGLLVLDSPISLPFYPTLASSPVPDGTKVKVFGRKFDGNTSSRQVSSSPLPLAVENTAPGGIPFDYGVEFPGGFSLGLIEGGDSGGGGFVDGTHHLVSVNSASGQQSDGSDFMLLGRVDAYFSRIQQVIAENR
jgi:Trypsin